MKRFLLLGLVLVGMGQMDVRAQSKNNFDDDIYYTSSQAEREAAAEAKKQEAARKAQQQAQQNNNEEDTYYSSTGEQGSDGEYRDDYIDYDDDYYYASQINRFNNPFYNRSYFSGFYNPYWYDPFWVDPYWGYNPWSRPRVMVSVGYGPMWSSYWGWQTWYGYGGFNSYYNYPYYAGYGGYWGCGSPYYAGYWNGYYAGLYNGYGGYGNFRSASYGPRYSLNAVNNSYIRNNRNGFRTALANTTNASGTPIGAGRSGFRSATGSGREGVRNVNADRNSETVRSNRFNTAPSGGRTNDAVRNMDGNISESRQNASGRPVDRGNAGSGNRYNPSGNVEESRPDRQRFSGAEQPQMQQQPRYSQPRAEQPRYEQPQAQPRYERPAMSQPRYEQPRMQSTPRGGTDFGGGRSSGGFGGGRSVESGGTRSRR